MGKSSYQNLTCFKAYDIRGEIGVNINAEIVYRIGQAVAKHFKAKQIIIGFDARETSSEFAGQIAEGITDYGADALIIGMAGTEEMYWAVSEFNGCAGIEVTASHNPINFNGLKIVKAQSKPLDNKRDFRMIKKISENNVREKSKKKGRLIDISYEARKKYVRKVLSFIDVKKIRPFKIVVNCGNGAAGPTFDAIVKKLHEKGVELEIVRLNHSPDPSFPNGIPNPMLAENQIATSREVKNSGADMGLAFDGDFDRCFFFDSEGKFISGEYIIGFLVSSFLEREKSAKIVHDQRVIWNILDTVQKLGGKAIASKTGHAYVKEAMRKNNAIYGGELSAHHYFRDFAFCDSGMLPWLLLLQLLSTTESNLGDWVKRRSKLFISSGEKNFKVNHPEKAISKILSEFKEDRIINSEDGLSIEGLSWRLNLRKSNTESLMRLNVETRGDKDKLDSIIIKVSRLLENES